MPEMAEMISERRALSWKDKNHLGLQDQGSVYCQGILMMETIVAIFHHNQQQ